MPRKPQRRSRGDARSQPLRPSAATHARESGRLFHQCFACGALVDPMFGAGESSWCPSCHSAGQVFTIRAAFPTLSCTAGG
jgi:hypothetical protein